MTKRGRKCIGDRKMIGAERQAKRHSFLLMCEKFYKENHKMFDIKEVEKAAREELAEEQSKNAKTKIKSKLKEIATARAIVANLEREYEILLQEIGAE